MTSSTEGIPSDPSEKVGGWYVSLCRRLGSGYAQRLSSEAAQKERSEKLETARTELRTTEDALARTELLEGSHTADLRSLKSRAQSLKKRVDYLDKVVNQTALKRELYFSGLDVTPNEVYATAIIGTVLVAVVLVALLAIVLVLSGFIIGIFSAILAVGVISVPFLLYIYLYNYPFWLSNRLRIQALGRAPETVYYMVMSMRLNPSLDIAVRYASENVDEPLAGSLKKVLWDVHTKVRSSIEDAFMAFADEWGHWNEDFKRAMYSIRMAPMERTDEGLSKSLEKGLETILSSTRKRIEEFATAMQSPTTVLFAFGILLPMIIGAMLPLIFLANIGSFGSATALQATGGANGLPNQQLPGYEILAVNVGFVLLIGVLFPLMAYIYSAQVLSKRPGTIKPPHPGEVQESVSRSSVFGISIGLGAGVGATSYLFYAGWLGSVFVPLAILPIVAGIGCGLSLYYFLGSRDSYAAMRSLQRLENELPDALFQVGNRITEGMSLERALERTADSMTGTEVAVFFKRIIHAMRVTGLPAEQAIFGGPKGPGLIELYPSRLVRVSLKALLEATSKGPEAVGRTVVPMSDYLNQIRQVDRTLTNALKPTTAMMRATAFALSPMILGMTGALYLLLSNTIAGGSLSVPIPIFFAVLGAFLIEMVAVISYFTIGVESGGDPISLRMMVGKYLWIAVTVFLFASAIGVYVVSVIG